MATNVVTVFCEGPHDVAFLTKILKADGYESNNARKIGLFPTPLNNIIKQEAQRSNIDDLNMQEVRGTLLPSSSLLKGINQIFLYSLGGDSRKDRRNKLLRNLYESIPKEGEILTERLSLDTILSTIYFFDADDIGIKKRLQQVEVELLDTFKGLPKNSLVENGSRLDIIKDKFSLGVYVFSETGKEIGKLEQILLPLMSEKNEQIFKGAEIFIEKYFDAKKVRRKKFSKQKSIIGTAGQLQKSGCSNFDHIRQTDYLTDDKILSNSKCIEIIGFFKKFEINE